MTVAHLASQATADDIIRAAVRGLAAARRMPVTDVAEGVGMPSRTLYNRLKSKGHRQAFTAGEVAALALFFGVPIADLYEGRVQMLPILAPSSGPPDPRPAGGAGALPRLDSNQEPAGNRPRLVPSPRRAPSLPHAPGGPYRELAA